MGTPSTTKFIKNNAGALAEQAALITSAGAADAQALVALNANGLLDATIINSTTTSAGVASAAKVAALNANGVLDPTLVNSTSVSSGASSAGKVLALDASGKIDVTTLPTGVGANTTSITTSEALSAGDYVNVWNSAGSVRVRKADATVAGKEAHGFVLSAAGASTLATVYFSGTNTAVSAQVPGVVFLSTIAGTGTAIAPSDSGQVVQRLGVATSATAVNFEYQLFFTLA